MFCFSEILSFSRVKVLMAESERMLLIKGRGGDVVLLEKNQAILRNIFFFLFGFSFTTIDESQDCRGRGRAFL